MRHFEVVKNEHRKNDVAINLPVRATKNSIASDFYSPVERTILPDTSVMFWNDVKEILNSDEAILIHVGSSMVK